jgi:hypothetical protein
MLSTNYEAINPLGSELRHAKRNPSTHRIPPKMRFFDCQRVEHRDDIGDPSVEEVRRRVVRFITPAVTARIDQHQPVITPEGVDITAPYQSSIDCRKPCCNTSGGPSPSIR